MKKISCFLIALVIGIMVAFGAVACAPTSAPFPEKPGFYNLYEAYTNGWLTKDDLMSIAYYHNGRRGNEGIMPENYTPKPKTPEVLSDEMHLAIRQTFWDERFIESNPYNITVNDILIMEYYGCYNRCVAVMIEWDDDTHSHIIIKDNIGGINFYYNDAIRISIWIIPD